MKWLFLRQFDLMGLNVRSDTCTVRQQPNMDLSIVQLL